MLIFAKNDPGEPGSLETRPRWPFSGPFYGGFGDPRKHSFSVYLSKLGTGSAMHRRAWRAHAVFKNTLYVLQFIGNNGKLMLLFSYAGGGGGAPPNGLSIGVY